MATILSAAVALVCHDGPVGLADVLMSLSDLVQMNVSPASLASLFEEEFKQDMAALKVSCACVRGQCS